MKKRHVNKASSEASQIKRNIKELLGWALLALAIYIIAYAYLLETN